MSKVLVIVESPAKAKTISKFLGRKYTVKASMGHIRDLPKSQFGVDVEHGFAPKYITIRGKGELVKELRTAAKKADQILLAPDPDREGEAIAWHLQNLLEMDEGKTSRIEFNEITKTAIENALKNPRPIDMDRVNAQQARRILDRLVGYNLSPLLWRKVKKGLSAGRVQSVAVRLICDREKEIQEFNPEEYWSLTALLNTGLAKARKAGKKTASNEENATDNDAGNKVDKKADIEAKLVKSHGKKAAIGSQEAMDKVLSELEGVPYTIQTITKKEKKKYPSPPFTTSSLQQEAYRKLNFSARKTMMVAQQLYEGLEIGPEGSVGLITYIRTDSTRIAEVAQEEAGSFIKTNYGDKFAPTQRKQYATKGKAQNAHEAVRPTSVLRVPDEVKKFVTRDQYRLYKLVWDRFVSSQMNPALIDVTSVDIKAGEHLFRASGSIIKFPGFMKVYIEDREEDEKEKLLPALSEGQQLLLQELQPKQHFTQPPPRYTDATLIKALEEHGIGRPSTYAPIVETVQKRGYVQRREKQFFPTELGTVVVDLLKEHFSDIMDIEFTAEVEDKLDDIEEGGENWVEVLGQFYQPFHETLEKAEEAIGRIQVAPEEADEECPNCNRRLVYKMGRYGKFLACPGFPECRFTKPIVTELSIPCPDCGSKIVQRRTKRGKLFYGCSKYPECTFVSWDQPTEKKCTKCGAMMVQKKTKNRGTYYKCIDENCK